ncbi:MAG: S58 family peptidase [Actinobacteria bacterium]|nr:MAG: S58 family peptidase [Actinomycetota bacterium]
MRPRLRELGIEIGTLPTGRHNAITDVPGFLVGHASVVRDEPSVVRTGVTVVLPREGNAYDNHVFAGWHVLNGYGEMTGLPWVEESGLIDAPIGITNTDQVGLVRDTLIKHAGTARTFSLPVVAETWDGWLSDIRSFALTADDVLAALGSAAAGPVAEGCVGGGTGMICHGFKGGIGTSSRVVSTAPGSYTVGVLVQANYGARRDLRVDGVPIGALLAEDVVPSAWDQPPNGGSIVVVIATDAPLLPVQCKRLARRATIGLARVGGYGHNSSGDFFLAIATGNDLPAVADGLWDLKMLCHREMDTLFHAVADATEEAILNALCAAETTTGQMGRTAHALPTDRLSALMGR